MTVDGLRLGELLVKKRLITSGQLEDAVYQQKKSNLKLGELLVTRNLITNKQLKKTLSIQKKLKKKIITTFFCLVPFHYCSAAEEVSYQNYQPVQLSSPYSQNFESKLNITFHTVMKGVNYLLSPKENYNYKQHKSDDKSETSNITQYDISFGKDSFHLSMEISF